MRHGCIAILVLALVGCATPNMPVGPWSRVPQGDVDSSFASMRAEFCIPKVSEIRNPIFPKAEVAWIQWSKRVPHCDVVAQRSSDKFQLIMMTTAPQEEVVQWYISRLAGFNKYPAKNGVLFVKGEPMDFSWERYVLRLPVPFISIGSPGDLWKQLGYQTSIDLGQREP